MNPQELAHEGPEARRIQSNIPFNRAARTGNEQRFIDAAIDGGHLAADGPFTKDCSDMLAERLGSPVLLVHTCTAALEMAAILGGIGISGGSPDEDQQICEDIGADARLRQARALLAVR